MFDGVDFTVAAGECVVLGGASGAGKSTFMRTLYGNYLASAGRVLIRHEGAPVDITAATPRRISRSAAGRSAMSASSCG